MARGKYIKRRKKGPIVYYVILVLLVVVLVGSLGYLGSYYLKSREQAEAYSDLAAMVDSIRGTAPTVAPDSGEAPTNAAGEEAAGAPNGSGEGSILPPPQLEDLRDDNGILLEYAPLVEINGDMAGWLEIEGTKINYPVMQTPGRADYYLHRNFQGEDHYWGCIYAREACDFQMPSDNITIYGHNMNDGSMFGGLRDYRERSYWEEHRYIRFDTLTEHHVYEIFAVFTTTATEGEGFAYHEFINAADEMAFDTFIAKCLSLSLYGTDIVPQYGDKIICLSTCEYSQPNGRLVVAAVRIS